jgi:predicted nucleotide-binding protein
LEEAVDSIRSRLKKGLQLSGEVEIELSLTSVLNRIRARAAKFATAIQKQLIAHEKTQSDSIQNSEAKVNHALESARRIFIGHGHSNEWKELRDFIQERLNLPWDEFNREPVAGITTKERLEQMLNRANFAFIVMTAEDEHPDGTLHARENVIHEAGLFQGRLTFNRAILMVEEGCAEFSNIHGLTQIRYPKGNILAASEEIRRVLEWEGILSRL